MVMGTFSIVFLVKVGIFGRMESFLEFYCSNATYTSYACAGRFAFPTIANEFSSAILFCSGIIDFALSLTLLKMLLSSRPLWDFWVEHLRRLHLRGL